MKKLFTLIGALLLWQSMAVAQNELHIWTGDTTKIVRMAELDSATVRDAEFYRFDINATNGAHYVGTIADYWGQTYNFDVTLVLGEDGTVYLHNLDPYFAQYGYTAEVSTNILKGEYTIAADGASATITCQSVQKIGYQDCVFVNWQDTSSPIIFTLTENTLTCNTGYGVCSGDSYYCAYNSFALSRDNNKSAAAPAYRRTEGKQLVAKPMPHMHDAKAEKDAPLQLMMAPTDVTIK